VNIEIGDFKNHAHNKLCEELEDVILRHATERQLSLLEAVGALEVVKLSMYKNQVETAEYESDD
jgi:hypothetical protein